jgi:hypothetical protein
LDIRLANTDRNGSNILVSSNADGTVRLTPIDHGYCLPSTFEDISFEWLYWPQACKPFTDAALQYIVKLDADADLALLAAHGLYIRPECARILRVRPPSGYIKLFIVIPFVGPRLEPIATMEFGQVA